MIKFQENHDVGERIIIHFILINKHLDTTQSRLKDSLHVIH